MKPTDFAMHVTNFLTHYLAALRNLSPNTIKAYRDVFTLLLRFCRDVRGIALERLSLAQIDASACGGVPRSPGQRSAGLNPHAKPSARGFACILPLRAVGSTRALAAVPADPGHSSAATCALDRRVSLQRVPRADPRATRFAYACRPQRCSHVERTLRHRRSGAGVDRSERRRCAPGPTTTATAHGQGTQDARRALDGRDGRAVARPST